MGGVRVNQETLDLGKQPADIRSAVVSLQVGVFQIQFMYFKFRMKLTDIGQFAPYPSKRNLDNGLRDPHQRSTPHGPSCTLFQDVAQQIMMELLDLREGMTSLQRRRASAGNSGPQQRDASTGMAVAGSSAEEDEALDELARIVEFVKRTLAVAADNGAGDEGSDTDGKAGGGPAAGGAGGRPDPQSAAARALAASSVTEGRAAGRGGGEAPAPGSMEHRFQTFPS